MKGHNNDLKTWLLIENGQDITTIDTKRTLKLIPLSANLEKWSNTLKQIVGNLPTICLSVFDYFMNLALKGLYWNFSLVYPLSHNGTFISSLYTNVLESEFIE